MIRRNDSPPRRCLDPITSTPQDSPIGKQSTPGILLSVPRFFFGLSLSLLMFLDFLFHLCYDSFFTIINCFNPIIDLSSLYTFLSFILLTSSTHIPSQIHTLDLTGSILVPIKILGPLPPPFFSNAATHPTSWLPGMRSRTGWYVCLILLHVDGDSFLYERGSQKKKYWDVATPCRVMGWSSW